MKIGVNLKIDVKKLDKEKFFVGKKGTYCDMTVFIDTENITEYDANGLIKQRADKGVDMPIIGDAKIFWRNDDTRGGRGEPTENQQPEPDDDIPF